MSYEPQHRSRARPAHRQGSSGISAATLGIASAASALAAFVVHHLWGPGTVLSAAATPVIVALASEFLRRPAERVSSLQEIGAVRLVPARERAGSGAMRAGDGARERTGSGAMRTGVGAERSTRYAASRGNDQPPSSRSEYVAGAARPRGVRSPRVPDSRAGSPSPTYQYLRPRRPWWRPALLTGLVAFGLVAVIFTVSDLAVGHSVTGGAHTTTFFGGRGGRSSPGRTPTSTEKRTSTDKAISKAPTQATGRPKATTAPGSAAPQIGSSLPGSSQRAKTTPAPSTRSPAPAAPSGTPSSRSSTPPPSGPAGSRSQAPGAPTKP